LIATAEQAAICGEAQRNSRSCDGNSDDNGDGCSDACQVETSYLPRLIAAAQNASFETQPQSPQWEILARHHEMTAPPITPACRQAKARSIDPASFRRVLAQTFATEPQQDLWRALRQHQLHLGRRAVMRAHLHPTAGHGRRQHEADTLTDIGQPITTTH
jgi:hypothetical protein